MPVRKLKNSKTKKEVHLNEHDLLNNHPNLKFANFDSFRPYTDHKTYEIVKLNNGLEVLYISGNSFLVNIINLNVIRSQVVSRCSFLISQFWS